MLPVLRIVVLVVTIYFLVALYSYLSKVTSTEKIKIEKLICSDPSIVLYVQREQIRKARLEIFGSSQEGFQGNDLDFYKYNYGTVEINVEQNAKQYSSIVYYRIFKNANDHIRTMLFNYVLFKKNKFKKTSLVKCVPNECNHPNFNHRTKASKAWNSLYFPRQEKRFIFTFVRDPIDRLISSITEVRNFLLLPSLFPLFTFIFPIKFPLNFNLFFHFIHSDRIQGSSLKQPFQEEKPPFPACARKPGAFPGVRPQASPPVRRVPLLFVPQQRAGGGPPRPHGGLAAAGRRQREGKGTAPLSLRAVRQRVGEGEQRLGVAAPASPVS
jgi:hypothetical protein